LASFWINTEISNFSKIVCHPSVCLITLSGIPDVRKYPIGISTLSPALRGSPLRFERRNLVPRACDPREGTWGSGIIHFKEESDWPLKWIAQFNLSQDSWLPATDYARASRSFPRIAGSGN
jgi:hypothetical protein